MDPSRSPRQVFQGNPVTPLHQPVPAEVVVLHDEQLAAIGALEVTSGQLVAEVAQISAVAFDQVPRVPNIASGLGATAEGGLFRLISTDPEVAFYTYRHDQDNQATLIETVPSAQALVAKADVARVMALETVVYNLVWITGGPVREHGASVTPTINWSRTKNSSFATVVEQEINGIPIGTGKVSWTAEEAFTDDATFSLRLVDGAGNESTASVTLDFQHRQFWASSVKAELGASDVLGLGNSGLGKARGLSRSFNPSEGYPWVWYCYPAEWGPPSRVVVNGFALDEAGYLLRTVEVTTEAGFTGDYYCLRLAQPQGAALTLEVG